MKIEIKYTPKVFVAIEWVTWKERQLEMKNGFWQMVNKIQMIPIWEKIVLEREN